MRKIIYTTTAIESLNRVIRKTTKMRGSFPIDEAATKLIYLAIRSFEKTRREHRKWVAARNQFAILYPEQFNKSPVKTAWHKPHTQSFRYSRMVGMLKDGRRVATPYDRSPTVFLSAIAIAATVIFWS